MGVCMGSIVWNIKLGQEMVCRCYLMGFSAVYLLRDWR